MTTREGKKKRSPNWSDSEVNSLVEIWKGFKKKLSDTKKNHAVYEEMSSELAGFYCYRTAEEIRTKIDNMAKRYKKEKTEGILKGVSSEWRFYWHVDEVLGLNPSFSVEYIKDNIMKKEEEQAKAEQQATILMFKYPEKNDESVDMDENIDYSPDVEEQKVVMFDESSTSAKEGPLPGKETGNNLLQDLFQEYKETQKNLLDTDKQILELLSNQNELIKTQNDLCQTQNAILKSLFKKMD